MRRYEKSHEPEKECSICKKTFKRWMAIYDFVKTTTKKQQQKTTDRKRCFLMSTLYKEVSRIIKILERISKVQTCSRSPVLGFNDMSTLSVHFLSSPRESEKGDSREDEGEGQGRRRNRNESEETEEIKTSPSTLTCYKDSRLYPTGKKSKRKVQGVPQSQAAAIPRHKKEAETDKTKHAQIEQTYEKHQY